MFTNLFYNYVHYAPLTSTTGVGKVQNVTCNWYEKCEHTPIPLIVTFIHFVTLKVSDAIYLLQNCLNNEMNT
jgi:hypothetical protein